MLNALARWVEAVSGWARRFGTCGLWGLIAGALVGGPVSLESRTVGGFSSLTTGGLVQLIVLLGIFAWIGLLFVEVAFVRNRIRSVVAPTFLYAFLVSIITLLVVEAAGLFGWAWLLGMLIGLLLGYALCSSLRTVAA